MRHAGWNEYHVRNFMKQNIEYLCNNATIKDKAKEVINKLKEEGNNIIIITSRSTKYDQDPYVISKKWLEKHGIKFDKLVVNSQNKADDCKKYKVDILIDDHVDYCKCVAEKTNTRVLMFDSPYNKECQEFTRVNSWQEVYNKIKMV